MQTFLLPNLFHTQMVVIYSIIEKKVNILNAELPVNCAIVRCPATSSAKKGPADEEYYFCSSAPPTRNGRGTKQLFEI